MTCANKIRKHICILVQQLIFISFSGPDLDYIRGYGDARGSVRRSPGEGLAEEGLLFYLEFHNGM